MTKKDAKEKLVRAIRMFEIHCNMEDLIESEKDLAEIEKHFAKLKAVLSNDS